MDSFIFDLDGTLLDSYEGILESVLETINKFNYEMNKEEVLDFILHESVYALLDKVAEESKLDSKELISFYKQSRKRTVSNYKLMDNSLAMLKSLYSIGCKLFIYTHKGDAALKIVDDNNLSKLFLEVIHSDSINFKRKPSPDVINYLVMKYNLNKDNTYYVGDRPIDISCANSASIKSILYLGNNMDLNCNPTYKINNLLEIVDIEKRNLMV